MKVYLVQGEHPNESGNPMSAHVTPKSADCAALALVNLIRAELTDPCDDESFLPHLEPGADWRVGLREWQRANIIDLAGANEMSDDRLAEETEAAVWIVELDVEDVPEPPAVIADLFAAGQKATEFLYDSSAEDQTQAADALSEAMRMVQLASVWRSIRPDKRFSDILKRGAGLAGPQPSELAAQQGQSVGIGEALAGDAVETDHMGEGEFTRFVEERTGGEE